MCQFLELFVDLCWQETTQKDLVLLEVVDKLMSNEKYVKFVLVGLLRLTYK